VLPFEILDSDNSNCFPEWRVGYSGLLQGNMSPDYDWLSPYRRH
jgi:hypothetical protein